MRRQPAAFLFGTRPMLLLTLAPILSSCPSLEAPKSEGADDRGRGRNGVSGPSDFAETFLFGPTDVPPVARVHA